MTSSRWHTHLSTSSVGRCPGERLSLLRMRTRTLNSRGIRFCKLNLRRKSQGASPQAFRRSSTSSIATFAGSRSMTCQIMKAAENSSKISRKRRISNTMACSIGQLSASVSGGETARDSGPRAGPCMRARRGAAGTAKPARGELHPRQNRNRCP